MLPVRLSWSSRLRVGSAALVAFLAACLCLALGFWQIQRTRDAQLADAEQNARTLAHALSQHAARTVESVDLVLAIAAEQVQQRAAGVDISKVLRQRVGMLSQARNVVVIDASGRWVSDTVPPHGPLSSADRDYFLNHRDHPDGALHVDSPIIGRTTGKPGIPLSRRVDAADGSFAGVVVATLAPEYFERFYGSVKIGDKGTVTLWTDDGHLLVRYPALTGKTNGPAPAFLQLLTKVFEKRSGVERSRSPFDGVDRIFAFEHVDGYPLVVSAAISVEEALAGWRSKASVEVAAVGAAAVLLILLGLGLETHRRRTGVLERASRELNRHYRLLAEHSSDLIALKPMFGGQRAFVSPSSLTTVGWTPDELAALPTVEFVHPDDLARVAADYAALTPDHPHVTSLHRVRHKTGHFIWLEARFQLTPDGSVVVAARDVTARQSAEQALIASEARYRLFADASSDMVQQLDLRGRRRYVSAAASEILGYEPADLVGTHPVEFIHPDDAERVGGWIDELLAGERDQARSIHRIRHKAGHFVWVEVQFRLVRSATGAPLEIVSNLRDVTQRETLRQSVEDANRRLVLAEEIAHVGHWRIEVPDNVLAWSDEVYRIHGVDPAGYEPRVETAVDFFHPDDRAEVARCIAQAMQARTGYEFRLRVVRPDGGIRHVLSRGLCETNQTTGEISAIFGAILDVTELSEAERRLTEKSALLEETLDTMDQALVKIAADGTIELKNRRFSKMLDLPPDLLTMPRPNFDDVLSHLEASGEYARMAAGDQADVANRGVPPMLGTYEHSRPDGTVLEVRTVPVPSGAVVRTYADITARRRAEAAMREIDARYRILAETTSDVITQLGLDLKRQYVSPSCRRVFGYAPAEMVGIRPSSTVHPDDAPEVRRTGDQLAAGQIDGDRAVMTYRTLHKDGRWVWIEAAMNLVRDADGRPASIICSLRDVTERQRVARHLERAKAAAEQAAQAKADFVANMSHELRTPLTAILGVHDLLGRDAQLSETQRHLIGLASQAGRSLLGIVNDVLDYSKIEAGQLAIDPVPFSLRDLVEGCRDLTAKGLEDKPVEIVIAFADDPGWLVGDPARLRQILLNLLTNAAKFTARGRIDIAVDYRPETALLRIEISDTGIGIADDKLSALFERFSQADSSVTRRYGGSGLGLAICKRLLDLMAGRIGVSSREGAGSTFWFELPLRRAASAGSTEPLAALSGSGRTWSILLAEDNLLNQEIIGAVLREHRHVLTLVPDGAAAVSVLRDGAKFDVVLMDLQMPVMDGLTATVAIRREEAAGGRTPVPIIGLTANALAEDAERCLAAGMNAHVAKPIEWRELFGTIQRVLGTPDPAPGATVPDVLDTGTLEELAGLIGQVRLMEIMSRFVDDLARRIEVLDQASTGELAEHMHSLISQAGQLGFVQLSRLCSEADAEARRGTRPHRIDEIRSAAARAAAAARSYALADVA